MNWFTHTFCNAKFLFGPMASVIRKIRNADQANASHVIVSGLKPYFFCRKNFINFVEAFTIAGVSLSSLVPTNQFQRPATPINITP